ncbi:hypothetical protein GCM10017771_14610 [Streptomyces capitiformicae]|uniref:Uncharacterized protein n=1 Tax=Streptomyces capitiformicae TaxID=2014920 RepID=A0A919L5B5_9ACTN|nr:hypothetical protein GCM10017771_14610 [Streptomyces capitiformicae]
MASVAGSTSGRAEPSVAARVKRDVRWVRMARPRWRNQVWRAVPGSGSRPSRGVEGRQFAFGGCRVRRERFVPLGGVELWAEEFGSPGHSVVLLSWAPKRRASSGKTGSCGGWWTGACG